MLPVQVSPPEVVHVIAGSVLTLTGPAISDQDTVNGALVSDNEWTYALDTGAVGAVVDSDTSLSGDPPFFAWQAPEEAAVAEMTMTAWDVGGSPTCDPATGTWMYEIHVHELAVYSVQGGPPFRLSTDSGYWTRSYPVVFSPVDSPWDSHTSSTHPTLSYSIDSGLPSSGWLLLEGGSTATMQVRLCAKDTPTVSVDVEDVSVALEIGWTAEGVTFESGSVSVTSLPSSPITLTTTTALNRSVSLKTSPGWVWEAEVPATPPPSGTQTTLGLTPPALEWVATSYGTFAQDIRPELTSDRIESVYQYLDGWSTIDGPGGIAVKAGQWSVSGCAYDGAVGWAQMEYPEAWHQKSIGTSATVGRRWLLRHAG